MNPVVVSFHGHAGDGGILQWLQYFNGPGEGPGEDLAGVEQITDHENKVDPLPHGVGDDGTERPEEIVVAPGVAGGGPVALAQVDVGVGPFSIRSRSVSPSSSSVTR